MASWFPDATLAAQGIDWHALKAFWTERYQLWLLIFQFLIVFMVVYWVYFRIQGTYVAQLLKGVGVVLLLYVVSLILNLTIIGGILQAILQISIIGFIILFQPELRRLLVYLGQPDLLGGRPGLFSGNSREKQVDVLIHELVESIRLLSKTKTGALIVLESGNGMGGNYLEAGTPMDARLSTELLLTIFHPNTPLHDGAVVIGPDNRLIAAGVLLPLSENPNLSWKYGTRHRAAIGLSETSDSRCLVVSEETGNIAVAFAGNIQKLATLDDLRHYLETAYGVTDPKEKAGRKPTLDIFQKLFSTRVGGQISATGADSSTLSQEERSRMNS